MAMNDLAESITSIVFSQSGSELENFATGLLKSRFAVASSMARNEQEIAEIQKMANAVKYVARQNGSSISFSLKNSEEYPFLSVIEEGLSGLQSGGDNGLVTEPSGDTHISRVPSQLQGTPLPWLSKEATPITDEAEKMIEATAPDIIEDIIQSNQEAISKQAAAYFEPMLQQYLGGK